MKILITAGPTREAIDPVRYLSNRSSGKMGYAIAEAAKQAGHEVLLISGPVAIPGPDGVELIAVESAQEMFGAVEARIHEMDAAIMSAAVADYRPKVVAEQKIKKSSDELVLNLERTPDILGSARSGFGFTGLLVGFAAETNAIETYAQKKLTQKNCDMIVANDVSQPGIGFDSDENAVAVFFRSGKQVHIPRASKKTVGEALIRLMMTQV